MQYQSKGSNTTRPDCWQCKGQLKLLKKTYSWKTLETVGNFVRWLESYMIECYMVRTWPYFRIDEVNMKSHSWISILQSLKQFECTKMGLLLVSNFFDVSKKICTFWNNDIFIHVYLDTLSCFTMAFILFVLYFLPFSYLWDVGDLKIRYLICIERMYNDVL